MDNFLSDIPDKPVSRRVPLAANEPGLQFKRVDKQLDAKTGKWVVTDTPSVVYEKENQGNDAQYSFVVERTLDYSQGAHQPSVDTQLLIHNELLIEALKAVMKDVQNLSWNVRPFQVAPQAVLTFLPRLMTYVGELFLKNKEENREEKAKQLEFLIEFLESEHATTLEQISSLLAHGEITFELLWAILIPHTIIFSTCSTTSEPRAYRLRNASLGKSGGCLVWNLMCDYIEASSGGSEKFGRAGAALQIRQFAGAVTIYQLNAYPIQWHPDLPNVRAKLIKRGKNWVSLHGVHHMSYNGVAYRTENGRKKRFKINGRVMIDRISLGDADPNYAIPSAMQNMDIRVNSLNVGRSRIVRRMVMVQNQDENSGMEEYLILTDDTLLLTTPILYGFSLTEKQWLEFNVELVTPIEWNDETFKNLALDPDRKLLIQSLVESHEQDQPLDDFVQGKGLGLVINLFGPPGVGKSLTVEATSEHLRKPLYIVSAGDLGTKPDELDGKLTKIFSMTPSWNAVVLIDEADVFLEERGTQDIARNAMVAVFLRQIEYFRGILFLTTNRVKTFDQAFQSRIHLSLHYEDLSDALKKQIWNSFLRKAAVNRAMDQFTEEELRRLSEENLNGRQIKNVVKMAVALAGHSNEMLAFKHLARTLDAMGRFGLSKKDANSVNGRVDPL